MNCKPGDLAVLVCANNPDHLGRLVDVLHKGADYENGVLYWRCKVHGRPVLVPVYDSKNQHTGRFESLGEVDAPDAWLRPIRDPGDDAQDETLQWLQVSSQHKEVA